MQQINAAYAQVQRLASTVFEAGVGVITTANSALALINSMIGQIETLAEVVAASGGRAVKQLEATYDATTRLFDIEQLTPGNAVGGGAGLFPQKQKFASTNGPGLKIGTDTLPVNSTPISPGDAPPPPKAFVSAISSGVTTPTLVEFANAETRYGKVIHALSRHRRFLRALRDAQHQAASIMNELEKQAQKSGLLGMYVASEGQDLRDVSMEFYGNNPEAWRTLRTFNDLDSSELESGQVILVPKIQASGA